MLRERAGIGTVIGLLVVLASTPSPAFTPQTRAEITQRAIMLMPDALERQLRRHAKLLYRTALDRPADLPAPGRVPLDIDRSAATLDAAVDAAVSALDQQRPMAEVVTQLGRVARVVQDLSLATHLGRFDARHGEFHRHYARYVESRMPKLRFVFGGFADPALARGDPATFARRLAERSRQDYPAIVRSYFPAGRERTAQDFDDRSVAFAVASVSVSRAMTATARAWLLAWHRAHGDLTGAAGLTQGRRSHPFGIPSAPSPKETSP